MTETPHITVCVCTYKRGRFLNHLLTELARQRMDDLFSYSVVVADNDQLQSAKNVVSECSAISPLKIKYCVEPKQNIALARNKALANATGDFIAFIDDDEFPAQDWLLKLFQASETYKCDGVLGPVLPHFEGSPPAWVKKGRFCDRPTHSTGFQIDWTEGRTGNVLLKRETLEGLQPVFRPEFGSGGEDRNFFRRMMQTGRVFIWCDEAPVYEWVPPIRWKRSFMLRRALLRGKMSLNQQRGIWDLGKSLVAMVGYTAALPVLLILGQHLFMKYLIKTCDHAGKVLAFLGLGPIRENYVLE